MDATDRIVSKVNAAPDVKVAEACVTVAAVSKVNAEACVELAVYDEVVPIPCVEFAVGDDKLPESNVRLKNKLQLNNFYLKTKKLKNSKNMNRKEIDLLTMMESVAELLDNNISLISDKRTIMNTLNNLKGNIVNIKLLKQKQAVSTKADYAIKEYKKEDMIANFLVIQAGVAAVGVEKGDVRLKTGSVTTEADLNHMRESKLVQKGHELYELAMTIPGELSAWNVTQQEVDDLGASTDSYLDQNPTIRNIRAKSTQATSEMKLKLDESYSLIKDKLDAFILPFKKINPTFYGEYMNTRIIISHAATHPKLEEKPVEVK